MDTNMDENMDMVTLPLSLHQQMFKILGLINLKSKPHEFNKNVWIKMHNIFVILVILSTLLPSIAYFWVNITDIKKTTDATYIIASMSMALGMYLSLVQSKIELGNLLIELQMIMNESKILIFILKM